MQETRELRALAIAATTKLQRGPHGWRVPSQSSGATYMVDPEMGSCTCPDHEVNAQTCKHLLAVRFTIRRERGGDGSYKITKVAQVTYAQEWTAYNAAQCEEKHRFLELLSDLCASLPEPPQRRPGRTPLPVAVQTFAAVYKVYSRLSSRRFTCDLQDAHAKGLIPLAPHFNSVTNAIHDPALTPVLKHLITVSALPLKAVETDFAVDSTGFCCRRRCLTTLRQRSAFTARQLPLMTAALSSNGARSVLRDLGGGLLGAGVVDEVLAGSGGRHQRSRGGVVE